MKNNGFTLVEILIAIFILVLLVSVVALSYRSFEKKTELKVTAQDIMAVLQSAQTKTLASESADVYGVHFETDKYVLFKGNSYNPLDANNRVRQLSLTLEIYDINLGGNSEVIFKRVTGGTDHVGSLSLRVIASPAENLTIYISSAGRLELSSTGSCCQTNRLADSRHTHLDFDWSIQGASVLRLKFTDTPEVILDINMADYFDALPSPNEFDWAGTINVNGSNQSLRVHTHQLDAFKTVLCIHRPQNLNNKPLEIYIDGQLLIAYDAVGSPTVGGFGGDLTVQ